MPDAVIAPEALLRHTAFLQSLARGLVVDPGLRDDAVQDTWVAAMRRPPREGKVRGWLATVLRNAVRKSKRGDRRRARREEACARPERTRGTSEQAAREEVLREVVAAVFALDARHREVVMLRFYEDLPPREIAARLGIPVNTVKSRLRRALGALRKDLGRSGSQWRPALLGLVGLKDHLLPAAGSTALTTTVTVGAIAVGSKVTAGSAAAAALLLGYGVWQWTNVEPAATEGGDGGDVAGLVDVANEERPALRPYIIDDDDEPQDAPTEGASTPPPSPEDAGPAPTTKRLAPSHEQLEELGMHEKSPPGVLQGMLFDGATPFSGGEALVWRSGGGGGPESIPVGREPLRMSRVDGEGRFRFDDLEDGNYFLGVRVPGQPARLAYRQLAVGEEETDKAIVVLGTSSVSGHVYDVAGRAVADVSVRISLQQAGSASEWKVLLQTRTDANGFYTFEQLPDGGGWLSVSYSNDFDDRKNKRSRRVSVKAGEHKRESFGTRTGTPMVTGTILTKCGEPIRGPGRLILSDKNSTQYIDSRYDEEGKFAHRVPPGTYAAHVWLRGRNRHPHAAEAIEFVVGERSQESKLVIEGVRIRGAVSGAARWVGWRRVDEPGQWVSSDIDEDGTYVIDGVLPGEYELRAWDQGTKADDRRGIVKVRVRDDQVLIEQDLVTPDR